MSASERTTTTVEELSSNSKCVTALRGPNWNDSDSLKLIDAYKQVLAEKEGSHCHYICANIPLGTERSALLDQRIAEKFLSSDPSAQRSVKSASQRWNQMLTTYKFIQDYSATRINGSTGKGPWFSLNPYEQKQFLGKNKVVTFPLC